MIVQINSTRLKNVTKLITVPDSNNSTGLQNLEKEKATWLAERVGVSQHVSVLTGTVDGRWLTPKAWAAGEVIARCGQSRVSAYGGGCKAAAGLFGPPHARSACRAAQRLGSRSDASFK